MSGERPWFEKPRDDRSWAERYLAGAEDPDPYAPPFAKTWEKARETVIAMAYLLLVTGGYLFVLAVLFGVVILAFVGMWGR